MKLRSFFKSLLVLGMTVPAFAGINAKDTDKYQVNLEVKDATLRRDGNYMDMAMLLDLSDFKMSGDRAVLFTPYIVNGPDSLALTPIGIYNRNRWYHYQRSGEMLGGDNAISLRSNNLPKNLEYNQLVAYQPWMNGSHVVVKTQSYGCCRHILAQEDLLLDARYAEFTPTFLYAEAPVEIQAAEVVKTREISGRAYVDFPVNQIVIYPDYHNNKEELGKILATIEPLKNDPDITVTSIWIKGTASPEGPYQNNVRLSKGRTEALKTYVDKQYNFATDLIKTDYEPVDWDGLRDYLTTGVLANGVRPVEGDLPNKAQILDIVNSDIESYARNQKIKTTYPSQYDWLLKNVYPTLRHSDYKIEYTIRNFTTVEEISALIDSDPGKLSLNEMYTLTQSYEPGSQDFVDTFEKIAVLYPDEEVANLNAGVAALERGDLRGAEKYLQRAGNSPEAIYARGNLEFLKGNYKEAKSFYEAAAKTLPQAQVALELFNAAGY